MNQIQQQEKEFIIHSCEQVLRFSRINSWNDLSEERKVQLGFNMGVFSLGLKLTKKEGHDALTNMREGAISPQEFHQHIASIVESCKIPIDPVNIMRPF